MADLTLNLEDSLKIAGNEGKKGDIRAVGALSAGVILVHQLKGNGKPDGEVLNVLERLLDGIQDAIDEVRAEG